MQPTSAQLSFHWSVVSAAKILLNDLEVPEEEATLHRLFRLEVVEVHPDVSFILLIPSTADVCSAPGQKPILTAEEKRGCLTIPVPVFEMAHLCTYQPDFISLYCRLSAFLDFFVSVLQQLLRQAFSDSETQLCRRQLEALTRFQQKLEEIWKVARWITDVTSKARDKTSNCSLPLTVLFNYSANQSVGNAAPSPSADGDEARNQSDNSDAGEDNSDIGYHSDQSMEKKDSTSQVDSAIPSNTTTTVPPNQSGIAQQTLENPIYGWPEHLDPPNTSQRTNRVYVNLPSTSAAIPLTESAIDSYVTGRSSFLQPRYTQKRYVVPESSTPAQIGVTYRTEITVGTPASQKHEYVNCPSNQPSDSESAASTPTIVRPSPLPSGPSSDTEVIRIGPNRDGDSRRNQQRKVLASWQTTHVPIEDLSMIDHLYSVASHMRSQTPVLTSGTIVSVPTPQTVSFNPTPPLTDRTGSRGSADYSPLQAGVLRVYAAYPCGLARGTSVKLQVTPKTTAREIVALVVQQLNKAAEMKGHTEPIYEAAEFVDFCLVAVIGARERCLRDDFPPLDLQNPWAKGRLYVRRRDDLLAALEYGNEAKV